MVNDRAWWVIRVTGFGAIAFYGTEEAAEQKRADESEAKRGVARKLRADVKNVFDRELVRAELNMQHEFRDRYPEELPDLA